MPIHRRKEQCKTSNILHLSTKSLETEEKAGVGTSTGAMQALDEAARGTMTKHFSPSDNAALWTPSAQWSGIGEIWCTGKRREKETDEGKRERKQQEWKTTRARAQMTVKRKWTTGWAELSLAAVSYAFHITFTVYVQAWMGQTNSSVEKTATELSLLRFPLPFFCFQLPSNPLRLRSFAFICSDAVPVFLCAGVQQPAFVSCTASTASTA